MSAAAAKALFPLREDSVARVARWFHALSDETRLRIIDRLSEGEQCVCELTDLLETGQSRLSFHLKTLKDGKLPADWKATVSAPLFALQAWSPTEYSYKENASALPGFALLFNADMAPEATQNKEVGTKLDLFDGRLSLSAAVFRLQRDHIKATDPATNKIVCKNSYGSVTSDSPERRESDDQSNRGSEARIRVPVMYLDPGIRPD